MDRGNGRKGDSKMDSGDGGKGDGKRDSGDGGKSKAIGQGPESEEEDTMVLALKCKGDGNHVAPFQVVHRVIEDRTLAVPLPTTARRALGWRG